VILQRATLLSSMPKVWTCTPVVSVAQDFMLCNFLVEQLKHSCWVTWVDWCTDSTDKSHSCSFPDVTGISLSTCCHDPSPFASYTRRCSWNTPSWIHLSILGAIARLNLPSVIMKRRIMKSRVATKMEKTAIRPRPKAFMVLLRISIVQVRRR
jgi:hypothetical protein